MSIVWVCGRQLIWQLCWYVASPGQRLSPPRAPTWSWASIKKRCSFTSKSLYRNLKYIELSKVLKIEKLDASENIFGDVPKAVLWLECPPLSVVTIDQAGRLRMLSGSSTTNYKCCIDCLEDTLIINKGNPAWSAYILRVADGVGLLLRPTLKYKGEYERFGI
ncbi:hypothetical protein NHQ30_008957 [Ciborinia camelliae]|nr:hypothetical protein NHQ30_008957 [Ciborinia camelliae]